MIRTKLNHESVIAIIGASSPSSLNPVQIHAQPSRSAKTWWERKQVFSSSSIHPMAARTKRRRMMEWHQREEMFLDLWRHKKIGACLPLCLFGMTTAFWDLMTWTVNSEVGSRICFQEKETNDSLHSFNLDSEKFMGKRNTCLMNALSVYYIL